MISRTVSGTTASRVGVALWLAIVAASLVSPGPCRAEKPGIGRNEGIATKAGKAGTMAGLAAMYDSGPCVACHRTVYDEWRRSGHSASVFGTGKTAAAFLSTVLDGLAQWPYSGVKSPGDVTVEHLMVCAKCHLPQLEDATDNVAREIVGTILEWRKATNDNNPAAAGEAAGKLAALNIGCLICHNRNAIVHKWTDGYPKAGEIYGSKEGVHHGKGVTALRKSPIMGESVLCGQCHGLGPNLEMDNPTQCSTVYGSYLYSFRGHGGKESCQDCHMRKSALGHDMRTFTNTDMVKAAIDVSTDTHGFFWRDDRRYLPRVIVDVTMTNKAGHSIPDSLSSDHRLVLMVTAKTSDGEQVFSQTRTYMPIPQRLGRGGRMGRGAYEKTGTIKDTSLPSLRPVRERFDIVLEPSEGEKEAGKRLSNEIVVDVKLRSEGSGDAAGAEGVTRYEFRKIVKIEGEW